MDLPGDPLKLVSLEELPEYVNDHESTEGTTNHLKLVGVVMYKGVPIRYPDKPDMDSGGHYSISI